MSEIQKFFEGHNLFITGGTGFIGKILVEKLLRSLPKVGKIYLLMRPKKGKDIQERFDEYFNIDLFVPLREKDPSAIKKVIPVNGDVSKPGLGLSPADREMLINEVSIVIHSAATTRFENPLNVALSINVFSVVEIIKLCRELKQLKVAVHVSTAFIESNVERIEEKVYPCPMTYKEANNAVEIMKGRHLSKENEKQLTKILLGDVPNTYVFTKAMAEEIINEEASDLPFCIYRFPVALGTYKEPLRGWIDVTQGLIQAIIWMGMGIAHILFISDTKNIFYIVPADFACNALIASTWDAGSKRNRKSEATLPVYNYVNGEKNLLTFERFVNFSNINHSHYLPSKAIYHGSVFVVKSKRAFAILNLFFHLLPALIGDVILKVLGKKPKLHKFYKRGMKITNMSEFFMEKSWSIDNKNIEALWEKLSPEDKILFEFDMSDMDYENSALDMWKGVIKYLLKEDITPETMKTSFRRYYTFLVIHRTLQALLVTFIIWLLWKLFCCLGFFF